MWIAFYFNFLLIDIVKGEKGCVVPLGHAQKWCAWV
jgi:hypothetical protein